MGITWPPSPTCGDRVEGPRNHRAVGGGLGEIQTDDRVVGVQGLVDQLVEHPDRFPLVPAGPQGCVGDRPSRQSLGIDPRASGDTGRYKLFDARCQLDQYSDFDVAVGLNLHPFRVAARRTLRGRTPSALWAHGRGHCRPARALGGRGEDRGTTVEREDWRVVGIITSAPPRTRRSLTCGRIQPVLRPRAAQDRGQRLRRGRF